MRLLMASVFLVSKPVGAGAMAGAVSTDCLLDIVGKWSANMLDNDMSAIVERLCLGKRMVVARKVVA
jgi:hypothetical protein